MHYGIIGAAVLAASPAAGQTLALEEALGAPGDLSYRGGFELDAGRTVLRGNLIRGDGHQRIDAWTAVGLVTVISDYAAATATVLVPGRNAHVIVPLSTPGLADYFPDPRDHSQVSVSGVDEIGEVDDVPAERRMITGITANGIGYGAEIWISAQGAILAVEGETEAGDTFEFELEDYELVEPAKTAFDIPAGLQDAGSLAALGIVF